VTEKAATVAESSNVGERSFEDFRVAIEQGTVTSFTVGDMKRVLQIIDALDGELADSTKEEMEARRAVRQSAIVLRNAAEECGVYASTLPDGLERTASFIYACALIDAAHAVKDGGPFDWLSGLRDELKRRPHLTLVKS
jgi:hypothetical protein